MDTFSGEGGQREGLPVLGEKRASLLAALADPLQDLLHELSFLVVDALLKSPLNVG